MHTLINYIINQNTPAPCIHLSATLLVKTHQLHVYTRTLVKTHQLHVYIK